MRTKIHAVYGGEYIPIHANSEGRLMVDSNATISTEGLATEATLGAVNTKIVSCDTTALATEASVNNMGAKFTHGAEATLDTAQQVGLYAYNSTQSKFLPVAVNGSNNLQVVVEETRTINRGEYNNLANDITLVDGATAVIDCSQISVGSLFYEDSNGSSSISPNSGNVDIQVSLSGTVDEWLDLQDIYPFDKASDPTKRASVQTNMSFHGFRRLRIVNNTGADLTHVKATICGVSV